MPLTHNTVVMASAGTGKTRKLVETWVSLVQDGADPLRIVAMTFTEKAAADMRARVREAIYERMKALPQSEHQTWTRVLALLPAAPISTIHGFCGLLLRENGLHAGIDPSFTILDEQRSFDLAREAAVDTIRNEIRRGNEEAAKLFGDFGLHALVDILVRTAYWMNSLGKDSAWLQERAREQVDAGAVVRESVAAWLDEFENDFERIGLFADERDAKRAKHAFRKRDDPAAVLPRIGQIAGAAVAAELSRLVGLSVDRFRQKKRAAAAMDFDDLLLETRNLLRDIESVRRQCRNRFQAVLVDEFQDTDDVQAEIVRLLTRDPRDESRFAPGKLLIVGDPKQSIYRFRRARVTVFIRMAEEIVRDGGKIEYLQENWRSAPAIAEFSNRLSESMMDGLGKASLGDDVDPSYRIRFSPTDLLVPRSDRMCLGITYIAAPDGARAAEGRAMEAEAVARLLKSWKSSGTIESWRDVAVLMRSMNNASIYVDAMEKHGIPVYVVEGTLFYRKNEVSDLIALLEHILHPEDPIIRATVLTSALAGWSFNDLLAGKTSETFDRIVAPWIQKRDEATAAEILEDVVRKTGYDVVTMAQKNGRQRVANIGKLIEITRNLARQGVAALDDVVRHLRGRAGDMAVREAEAQIVSQDEDVVRLLTVHRSKGLEFDVVIVPDLAVKTPASTSNSMLCSDRWGLLSGAAYGLHRKTLPHSLILHGKSEEEDQQFEEEKRLLYVAVTRARRMLVLGEGFSGRYVGPWHRWVTNLFESVQQGAIERARQGKTTRIRFRGRGQDFSVEALSAAAFTKPEQLALNIDMAAVSREPAFREFEAIGRTLGVRRAPLPAGVEMTPSELAELRGCFRYFHWTRLLGLPEPGKTRGDNTEEMRLGRIVHGLLESGRAPESGNLREGSVADLRAVFESREWLALQTCRVERELPFIACVRAGGRDCYIRGRMDAVVLENPPRVIDYKYALWRNGTGSEYRIQMAAYCLALMKSLGTDRAIAELWYLKTPMKVLRQEYTREEAEILLADLLGKYLQSLAANDWPKAERAHCDSIGCGFRERCWSA